ncbi:MAG: MATE family efflux transporter [Muribaculaceae bacterium]|nr:MATE family efflux transporter [Muribaculaceae bacterium]
MSQTDYQAGLDYGDGSVPKLFFKIFFPTLLGMVFNALLTVVDGIFVGRGVGPDGIAAVNIIAPLYMVVTGLGLMFGIGASVVAGVMMSQGDNRRASIAVTQAAVVSIVIVTVLVGVLLAMPEGVAIMLGCSDALMPHALDYLLWLLPGIFFLLIECIGMMVVRLDGSPKFAMMCNIIPAVINIGLDYWLVFPMGMGVKGAATATSASIAIGAFMVVFYFCGRSYVIKIVWSAIGLWRNMWRQVCVGSSAFITEIAMSVMMLTGNYVFMNYYGEAGVAAYSIACYLFPVMFMMSNSVAQSAQPIISYNYGAGSRQRVSKAFGVSLAVAVTCGIISASCISLGAESIVAMFIDPDCEAGRLASAGLPVYALCAVFFAANIAVIGYCQSVEDAWRATLLTLLRGVIFVVPAFLLLPLTGLWWSIWAAIPVSEAMTLIVIGFMAVFKGFRKG